MDVKEYLVSIGYSNEDATTFASDTKMAKAFEASAKQYEEGVSAKTAAEKQTKELNEWWKNEAQPSLLSADSNGAQAKADAARYRTYLEDMKAKGYPVDESFLGTKQVEKKVEQNQPNFDPKQFAYETADATALLYDLGNEYQDLYGTPLPNAHGLLQEAKASRISLRDHVRTKFNFDGKRTERTEAKVNERIEAARKEEREKAAAESAKHNNPLLAPAITSRAAAAVEAAGDHADSWKTKQGRNEAKRDRLLQFRNVATKVA